MTKKLTKQHVPLLFGILRIVLLAGTITSMFFVPWILLKVLIIPMPIWTLKTTKDRQPCMPQLSFAALKLCQCLLIGANKNVQNNHAATARQSVIVPLHK